MSWRIMQSLAVLLSKLSVRDEGELNGGWNGQGHVAVDILIFPRTS